MEPFTPLKRMFSMLDRSEKQRVSWDESHRGGRFAEHFMRLPIDSDAPALTLSEMI